MPKSRADASRANKSKRSARRAGSEALAAENPKNTVNSVSKAFSVLRAFSAERPTMTLSEVAEATEMDRGTVFRLLHTLRSLGYLRQEDGKRFRLGLKCLELGFVALSSHELWFHAAPFLRECVPTVVDAASLGVLDGPDVMFVHRFDDGFRRQDIDRRPGRRIRAYGSALGHVLLAWLPEEKQIEILNSAARIRLSERTLTDLDLLVQRLREVRTNGYAVSDGENAFGLRTIAVPIFRNTDVVIAGISLTVDSERMSIEDLVASALPRARAISDELSNALRVAAGLIDVRQTK